MVCLDAIATPSSQTITLGALTHLLPPAGDLAGLHDELRPAQLLQAMQRSLVDSGDGAPTLLTVDDAHLLDPVSAHLIAQLAMSGAATVVLTVRAGETVPPAITSLWKDDVVARIDIEPFDQAGTSLLAQSLLGAPLDTPALVWAHRTSAGNALFARELVLGARDTGALVRRGPSWTLVGHDAPTVSPRLADLVDQRLAGLGHAERRALDLIALAEPIGLDLAALVVGEETLGALDEHGLLQMVTAGHRVELRPAHPLYGEALRQRPLTLRRRGDLVALVDAVRALGARRRDDAVRLAMWQRAAGESIDAEVLLRAAVAAQAGFDDSGAVRLAELGLEQRGGTAEVVAELRLCAGTSLARLGSFDRADAVLALVEADEGDEGRRARIALRRAYTRFESADDLDGAQAILVRSIAAIGSPRWRTELRLHEATMLADGGRPTAAALVLEQVAVPADDDGLVIAHYLASSSMLAGLARWTEAMESSQRGFDHQQAHPATDTTFHPSSQLWYRITALQRGGWMPEAEVMIRGFRDQALATARPIGTTVARTMHARYLLDVGRIDEAREQAMAALDGWTESLQPYLHRWVLATAAWIEAVRGDVERAVELASQVRPGLRMSAGMSSVDVAVGLAVVDHARGRRADAHRRLAEGIVAAAADGDLATESELLSHDCVIARRPESAKRLLGLIPRLDPAAPITRCFELVATGVATDDHEAIAVAGDAYASIGLVWQAALVADAASDCAERHGVRRAATAHRAVAAGRRAQCTGLPGTSATPTSGLTDRELEIALLVADGLSSKQVAAALVLSSRTVDNHLQRIYTKLGVTTRQQLASALQPR